VDTGTSMLAGPSDLVEKLSSMVNAKADCSNFDQLPNLGFKIGNTVLNLRPDDYMDRSPSGCSFSIMALDVPPPKGPVFIFGDPFLRRFVTIYDRSKPAVGFAVAKHDGIMDEASASQLIAHVGSEAAPMTAAQSSSSSAASELTLHLDAGNMNGAMDQDDHSSSETSAGESNSADTVESMSSATADGGSAFGGDDSAAPPEATVTPAAAMGDGVSEESSPASHAVHVQDPSQAPSTDAAASHEREDPIEHMYRLLKVDSQDSLIQRQERQRSKRLVSVKLHRDRP